MTLNLQLEYQTAYGEELYVVVGSERTKSYPMQYIDGGVWCASIKLATAAEVAYRYEVRRDGYVVRKEWGDKVRTLLLDKKLENLRILDRWHDMPSDRSFFSSMFTDGVFARTDKKKAQTVAGGYITIRADIAVVRPTQKVVLVGDCKALGNWDVNKGVELNDAQA
ncbi:MAG: hypothetical protein II288_00285, partial [Alistipes sp.]|nr:hypothetical protein [Alistipes sp.]